MRIKVEIKTLGSSTNPKQKASADVILDDCFVIRRVRLVDDEGRVFVSMPSFKDPHGKWNIMCHPLTVAFRDIIFDAYMEAYISYLDNCGLSAVAVQ